jgi:hypothetical protein
MSGEKFYNIVERIVLPAMLLITAIGLGFVFYTILKGCRQTDRTTKNELNKMSLDMNVRSGCEIYIDAKGQQYFRGAGTDWCFFPVAMVKNQMPEKVPVRHERND